MSHRALPPAQGLYDPRFEHDGCGVGFIAHIKGHKNHTIIKQGLEILTNLTHRGAEGADKVGDGAGLLIQIPDQFLREECVKLNISLPKSGNYGVGMVFLPRDPQKRADAEKLIAQTVEKEGQILLGWREVPTQNDCLSAPVKAVEPVVKQVFVGKGIVYKGMLLADQVGTFYPDLSDERIESALALVHQRFSTNTFPTWDLAHPFRLIAHNGEINTLRGNVNWMAARRASIASNILGDDVEKLWPLIAEGQSDSASFDNALELLLCRRLFVAHAMMLLIPEAWAGNGLMDEKLKAFYEYNAALMEPWDGPAAMAFTDGRQIGATLDRNGLRPARYLVTDDDFVIMASEMGVIEVPQHKIIKKWRLQPGKMLMIDTEGTDY
jgi:glutamate synthase (NADPH) large chain